MRSSIWVLRGAISAAAQGWDKEVPGHLQNVGSATKGTLCDRGTLITAPLSPLTLDMKNLFLLQSLAPLFSCFPSDLFWASFS